MNKHEQIEEIATRAIESHVFPGCQVGYIRGGKASVFGFGHLTYDQGSPTVNQNTIYDVASITKSIPTASLVLTLVEAGKLSLADRVAKFVPELQNAYRDDITVWHLLTYTAIFDLPAGMSGLAKEHGDALMSQILKAPLIAPPGETYYYTNAPAAILGLVAERVAEKKLSDLADETFFKPLRMAATSYRPQGQDIAPTELVAGREIRGVVHDEGARAIGEPMGHAGLFSTAGDLLIFAQMLLDHGKYRENRYFSEAMVNQMHSNQLGGGLRSGLGWELYQRTIMGDHASETSFGKTGFTGCLIVIDPKKEVAMVHLSNRTYPSRPESRDPIDTCRRELADIVFGG